MSMLQSRFYSKRLLYNPVTLHYITANAEQEQNKFLCTALPTNLINFVRNYCQLNEPLLINFAFYSNQSVLCFFHCLAAETK